MDFFESLRVISRVGALVRCGGQRTDANSCSSLDSQKTLYDGLPRTREFRMAFSLSRPSRRSRSASRAGARVWTAALRHALPRVRAIRP